jgi:predicted phosphodiesterase
MHDDLERLLSEGKGRANGRHNNRILVIGDVHGCLEELQNLVQKATRDHNNGQKFAAIILVGDLCNKGPSSAETIAYVRHQPRWFSIRGNHDDRALAAALGDEEARSKPKYAWVDALSDEDVNWMSELPYTITIPKSMLNVGNNAKDIIIVHAGLVPTTSLTNQSTQTMVTIRNLIVEGEPMAWAKLWQGPELVIFGHDAKRGLQKEEHAIGLDSGCVYGNKLTGIILPEREYVSVNASREYCPIKKKA